MSMHRTLSRLLRRGSLCTVSVRSPTDSPAETHRKELFRDASVCLSEGMPGGDDADPPWHRGISDTSEQELFG